MKTIFRLTVILTTCIGVQLVHAASSKPQEPGQPTELIQAIQTGKITKLFVSNSPTNKDDAAQRVIVRLEGDVPGGHCPKKVFWQMLLKNEAERAQYDLLLASYMNGKSVKIWGNKDAHCIHKGERIRNVEIAP